MFKHHPAGLFPLFFTEMWERFSFYIMVALLTLYMDAPTHIGGLGFAPEVSAQVYGLYMGFLYFTPLFGGLLADRVWGFMRTITLGGIAMMCGHLALAGEGVAWFFTGLAFLIVGNGLFKPNISTMLGNLYRDRPHLKDQGFNLFYMGINMGAFAAPLVATWLRNMFLVPVPAAAITSGVGLGATSFGGALATSAGIVGDLHANFGQRYGWHYAFGIASIGMLISLVIFRLCRARIVGGEHARFVPGATAQPDNNGQALTATAVPQATPEEERIRVRALFIIFGVVMLFWMAFHQNGMTLIRWARDHTSPFLGIDFRTNAALTKAINPALVIILTPLLVLFWTALRKRNLEASTPRKMMFGMLLTASCFLVMAIGGLQGGDYGQVSIWWLLGGYFLVTLGELCVSPMGLSVVSKLAPARHGGLLMGGWFVATALGNYLAGAIAVYWQIWDHSTFFFLLVATSLLAAAVLWCVMGRLEHAMSLVTPTPVRATPPGDVEPQPVETTAAK